MLGDNRKLGRRYYSAIEAADRCRDLQGLKQHPHAAGRAAADDREKDDPARVEFCHGSLRALDKILSSVTKVPSTSETTAEIFVGKIC